MQSILKKARMSSLTHGEMIGGFCFEEGKLNEEKENQEKLLQDSWNSISTL